MASFIAEVNGRTRSAPNSAVASSSSCLPWVMESSAETSASRATSSSVGVGRRPSESVSAGSRAFADSICLACCFFEPLRVAAYTPPPASAATPRPPASQPAPLPAPSPDDEPPPATAFTAFNAAEDQFICDSCACAASFIRSISDCVHSSPPPTLYKRSSGEIASTAVLEPLAATALSTHSRGVYCPNERKNTTRTDLPWVWLTCWIAASISESSAGESTAASSVTGCVSRPGSSDALVAVAWATSWAGGASVAKLSAGAVATKRPPDTARMRK